MYITETTIRTRYAETDQMGYVYYGNYAQYFEVGRVEALRNLGISYRDLEAQGFLLPVVSLEIKFHKPAFYDELLTIITKVAEIPSVRLKFEYETYNQQGELLNSASTTLVFLNKETKRPCQPPKEFIALFNGYFK